MLSNATLVRMVEEAEESDGFEDLPEEGSEDEDYLDNDEDDDGLPAELGEEIVDLPPDEEED